MQIVGESDATVPALTQRVDGMTLTGRDHSRGETQMTSVTQLPVCFLIERRP
jgi:hypothetical protein